MSVRSFTQTYSANSLLARQRLRQVKLSGLHEALRFNVYDQAGLLDCPRVTTKELLEIMQPFKDREDMGRLTSVVLPRSAPF